MSRIDELRELREKQHARIMASRGPVEAQQAPIEEPTEQSLLEEGKPKGRGWPAKGSRKIANRKNM